MGQTLQVHVHIGSVPMDAGNLQISFEISEICFHVRYNPASISIKHLLDHGKHSSTHNSFLFLKKEIPTRLANMIMELQLLPPTLRKQKECNQILNDYISSFRDLLQFEIKKGDKEDLESFTDSLNMIRRRHLDTVPLMAQAVIKMSHINQSEGVTDTVQYFLDRLYTNR